MYGSQLKQMLGGRFAQRKEFATIDYALLYVLLYI